MRNKIDQSDIIQYEVTGFDSARYLKRQKTKILERIGHFKGGRLYLEIGGKFLFDPHAARVLPGFDPAIKKQIFQELKDHADLYFCIDYRDVIKNRQLSNEDENYSDAVLRVANQLSAELGLQPKIVVNLCERKPDPVVRNITDKFRNDGFEVFFRYRIEGYPHDTQKILSRDGFGQDDYIPNGKPLVLVTGAASNSGKMSTCIGQIYLDHLKGIDSGYAKYETFPIWNLPLEHPVNLAYEAATADIGDYNTLDTYHQKAYGKQAVNYNRDVDAFELLMTLSNQIVSEQNYIRAYRSPTDMGINQAGFAITDDAVVSKASIEEIERRKNWYRQIVDRGEGDPKWALKCEALKKRAESYLSGHR